MGNQSVGLVNGDRTDLARDELTQKKQIGDDFWKPFLKSTLAHIKT